MSYLPASFRGVPFDVSADGLQYPAGRRVVVSELPYRDDPVTEDLGLADGPIALTAIIAGPGYELRREALLDALDEPGPGILVHPTRGRLEVVVEGPLTVTEAAQTVTIPLVFRRAGPRAYPITATAVADVASLADAVRSAAAAAFAASLDIGGAVHVATSALATASDFVDAVTSAATAPARGTITALGQVSRALARLDSELAELLQSPEDLAERLFDAVTPALDLETVDFWARAASGAGAADDEAATDDPSAEQIAANGTAIRRLFDSALVSGYAQTAVSLDWTSYDDASTVRTDLASLFDAVAAWIADVSALDALLALRAATLQALSDTALTLPRLRTVTVDATTSVLELAHELYGDAERALDVLARNDIAHPGFLVSADYRVLSS